MAFPVLELVTPVGASSRGPEAMAALAERVAAAVEGGVRLVQVRDPGAAPAALTRVAAALREATLGRASLVVNSDESVAEACGADGVHLPERLLHRIPDVLLRAAAAARGASSPYLVGCSVHSEEAAVRAASLGATYLQIGTMFPTASHPGKTPEGLQLLADVRRRLAAATADLSSPKNAVKPPTLICIGGIGLENCRQVAAAGADGVAVISALCDAAEPKVAAAAILQELRRARVSEEGTNTEGGAIT